MKAVQEVRQIGTANPVNGSLVGVQTSPANVAVTTGASDSEGLALLTAQGTPGNVRIRSERQGSSYDVYSASVQSAGRYDLETHRTRIKALINPGVHPSYGQNFSLISTGSGQITIGSGAVVIDGILATFPLSSQIAVTNGDRALVAVLTTDAVALVEIAYSAINAAIHVPIWRYTVSAGNVVSSSLDWIAAYAGKVKGRKSPMSSVIVANGTTLSAAGEDAGLSTTLTLDNGVTYQVTADASVIGRGRNGAIAVSINGNVSSYVSIGSDIQRGIRNAHNQTIVGSGAPITILLRDRRDTTLQSSQWVLSGPYGPTFNGLDYGFVQQIAVDSSGNVYLADNLNNRLVKIDSNGAYVSSITGLSAITGVCVDSSGNIYVTVGTDQTYRKYSAALALQWSQQFTPLSTYSLRHITTDNTNVYFTIDNNVGSFPRVYKALCSTGAIVTSWGAAGSGNGQFNTPKGVVYNAYNGQVYVVDSGNSRVQLFNSVGVYTTQFSVGAGAVGIANEASGVIDDVWVASASGNALKFYDGVTGALLDTVATTNPQGVAVLGSTVLWANDGTNRTVKKWNFTVADLPFEWDAGLLTARAVPRS